jgi:N-acetyl-anhydromuramyl-L-alanine amidase AmpD
MNIIETNLKFGTLSKRSSTKRIILHHAAMNGSVEAVHNVHRAKGWSGIGYHFYVRKDGSIYRGRPEYAIGAHASGSNYNSIGICAEGNFENETMSDAQKNAIKELIDYLKNKYKITTVVRHRDVGLTACPGKNYPFDYITNGSVSADVSKPENNPVPNVPGKDAIVRNGQTHANNFAGVKISVDGIRGVNTIKAGIKVLQTAINLDYKKGIAVDGIWGNGSKTALGSHYVKRGEKQYMVTAVQILLMLKGYVCQLECPGIFGSNLESAVKQYQRDYQLTVDGIVGYNTFMSLIH